MGLVVEGRVSGGVCVGWVGGRWDGSVGVVGLCLGLGRLRSRMRRRGSLLVDGVDFQLPCVVDRTQARSHVSRSEAETLDS